MTEASPQTHHHQSCANLGPGCPHCESRVNLLLFISCYNYCSRALIPCIPPAVTRHRPRWRKSARFRDALAATLAQCVVDPEHDTLQPLRRGECAARSFVVAVPRQLQYAHART
jgi:hypothetical protein